MHTQCREKTKDIDHTFQMVGGQSSVHVKLVTSEVDMKKSESFYILFTGCSSLIAPQQIQTHTCMKYYHKLMLVYGMTCCMGIQTQQYGKMEQWRRRLSIEPIHNSPGFSIHGETQTWVFMRNRRVFCWGFSLLFPIYPHMRTLAWWSTWEPRWQELLGWKLELWSQGYGVLLWKLSILQLFLLYFHTLLSSHLSSDDTKVEPSHGSLSHMNPQSQLNHNLVYSFWNGANLAKINYLGHMTAWHARRMARRRILAKGGGLSNMDGNRPSRFCLPPSQAPGAPSHGQALQIQAFCTHHTGWCWHWCSQACLWPHRYSSHNPSLRHWRKSKWICGLCSQFSPHPGQWLTCRRKKHYWSRPTSQEKQQALKGCKDVS